MSLNEANPPAHASNVGGSRSTERDAQVPAQAALGQYEYCGSWIVVARGDYDAHSVKPLADALADAAAKHSRVVVDASGITFADSALLNLLILTRRTADVRLAAPTRQLRRILEITGVDTVLKVGATVEEAACEPG
ncbi:STAS domain-containing protein [Streptomyces sp. NPDC048392]|uniref:STAS domain-containing protein n=1 Tax=Streptomyces sp. NPDC048392 TaxID=3365543 RepID=UPI003712E4CF